MITIGAKIITLHNFIFCFFFFFFRINFPDYVIFVYITELVSDYFLGYVVSCVVLKYTMWTLDYTT